MTEKSTKLEIKNPKYSKREILELLGYPAVKANFARVSFKGKSLGNRCPLDITDELIETINLLPQEAREKWEIKKDGGGFLYADQFTNFGKDQGFPKTLADRRNNPQWIWFTSEIQNKKYKEHDKRILETQKLFVKNGILPIATDCQIGTSAFCEVMSEKDQLRALRVHNVEDFGIMKKEGEP